MRFIFIDLLANILELFGKAYCLMGVYIVMRLRSISSTSSLSLKYTTKSTTIILWQGTDTESDQQIVDVDQYLLIWPSKYSDSIRADIGLSTSHIHKSNYFYRIIDGKIMLWRFCLQGVEQGFLYRCIRSWIASDQWTHIQWVFLTQT